MNLRQHTSKPGRGSQNEGRGRVNAVVIFAYIMEILISELLGKCFEALFHFVCG